MFYNTYVVRFHPKFFVFPSIIFSALLIFIASSAIAAHHIPLNEIKHELKLSIVSVNNIYGSLSKKYPESIQKWRQGIEASAVKYNLDPNLIAAVMLQESGGQPSVISASGAVGLMQIMPKDGLAAGFICGDTPCFRNRPTIQELLDPIFNIYYGARMLSGLQTSSSSLRSALKSYGPMDVEFNYADIVLSIYSKNS